MNTTTDWFTSWFNTPYYHILYKHRNDADAQFFMRNITSFLQLPKLSRIADLPCGKGRHAVYLNSLGYDVVGGDLSENSIEHAKQFENDTLHFEVWDMRKPIESKYDVIAASSAAFLASALVLPASNSRRICKSSGGRRSEPMWSARNGGCVIKVLSPYMVATVLLILAGNCNRLAAGRQRPRKHTKSVVY